MKKKQEREHERQAVFIKENIEVVLEDIREYISRIDQDKPIEIDDYGWLATYAHMREIALKDNKGKSCKISYRIFLQAEIPPEKL